MINLILSALVAVSALAQTKILEESTAFPGSKIYRPNDGGTHPAVIVLHGSEGGSLPYYQLEAQALAAEGYVALAYCWYNCRKSPITSPYEPLENIEIRKLVSALNWLKKHPNVGGKKIAVSGFSRGAELSVVLGALPESRGLIDAIAAHSASDTVVSGFTWAARDKRCWICKSLDLSCFNGSEDFSQWNWSDVVWNRACGAHPKNPSTEVIPSWIVDGKPMVIGSRIEIESFTKPIFLTVGDQDEVWDYRKTVRIADQLQAAHLPVELHVFPGERHNFSPANENLRRARLVEFLNRVLN